MKYHYTYRTPENEMREGIVKAKNRNDVYAQLKKQGIKPSQVFGRDPIGWKRWAAIGVLCAIVAVLSYMLILEEAEPQEQPRAQLYGDPATIQHLLADGWRKSFEDEGDAWLARHAIPASMCDCREIPPTNTMLNSAFLSIGPADSPELTKMKRMINGMKRELAEYLAGGGTPSDYMVLCDERLEIERGKVAIYKSEFDKLRRKGENIEDSWERLNSELREMGLPTVIMPVEV